MSSVCCMLCLVSIYFVAFAGSVLRLHSSTCGVAFVQLYQINFAITIFSRGIHNFEVCFCRGFCCVSLELLLLRPPSRVANLWFRICRFMMQPTLAHVLLDAPWGALTVYNLALIQTAAPCLNTTQFVVLWFDVWFPLHFVLDGVSWALQWCTQFQRVISGCTSYGFGDDLII